MDDKQRKWNRREEERKSLEQRMEAAHKAGKEPFDPDIFLTYYHPAMALPFESADYLREHRDDEGILDGFMREYYEKDQFTTTREYAWWLNRSDVDGIS